jgi:glyoxylase-like metal-dependent hydrolase (beta-lactamase superfamily II)
VATERPRSKAAFVHVGDIEVTAVSDGRMLLPAVMFFPTTSAADWVPHRNLLTEEGQLPLELGGFLVRTGDRVILVDAGIGKSDRTSAAGGIVTLLGLGALPHSLLAMGLTPDDITDVVFTHLHFDHVGWASLDGTAVFRNATYRCHQADWDFFFDPELPDIQTGRALGATVTPAERMQPVAERILTWDSDATIAPGVSVRTAPGHTPGSTVVVVSSGTERAVLLGDVVHCPAELLENDWAAVGDVDPALAKRTRQAWADEIEGSRIPASAAHFPGMQFGRLLPGQGKRNWVFD